MGLRAPGTDAMETAARIARALETRVVKATCPHDCPDACGMRVTVDARSGRAIRVEGDPTHPVTRGYLCNKVNNYLDLVYNDNRVLYPRRRVGPKGPGAKFERITWDEALAETAARLKAVIAEYGPDAVQPYSYSGTLGVIGFTGMGERFFNRMGAARLERTICTAAGRAASLAMTGLVHEANIEDLPGMEVVILWATNLVSTGIHAMPFIDEARANGARIIAIDPRVTRTTRYADWHLQPKPGTDAALALAMLKVIVDRGLHDEAFLRAHTVGWERLVDERLGEYTLERAAAITGIPAADIERLALLYGGTRRSFIRLNWGIQRHDNGGAMTRAIRCLPVFTGAMATGGGICVGTGNEMRGVDPRRLQRTDLLAGRTPRTINMIQLGMALEDPSMAPPIKALFVWNSDPANCVPDTVSARRGMQREDLFTVVHDTFFTDTCDYADIVLPADSTLERTDIVGAYGNYYFGLSQKAIEPLGESVDNSELFRRLAVHMGYDDDCFRQSDESMIREILDPEFNPLFEGITWESLMENGWARADVESPRRPGLNSGRWPTPSGKIEIWCESLKAMGLDPLPGHVPEREGQESPLRGRFPLQVISAATHHFIGASFQHVPRLQEMMARQTFEVSAEDADARGIASGDLCRLFNDRGEVFGHALVVPGLLPGVVGAPKQLQGSKQRNGCNINALVSQDEADMGRGPVFYSTLAELEKVADVAG